MGTVISLLHPKLQGACASRSPAQRSSRDEFSLLWRAFASREELGLPERLTNSPAAPTALCLITGPTGAGKPPRFNYPWTSSTANAAARLSPSRTRSSSFIEQTRHRSAAGSVNRCAVVQLRTGPRPAPTRTCWSSARCATSKRFPPRSPPLRPAIWCCHDAFTERFPRARTHHRCFEAAQRQIVLQLSNALVQGIIAQNCCRRRSDAPRTRV